MYDGNDLAHLVDLVEDDVRHTRERVIALEHPQHDTLSPVSVCRNESARTVVANVRRVVAVVLLSPRML